MSAPDVIVGWLQNDYGTLGRAGEAIAHALVRNPTVGRVAYVEPFVAAPGEPELNVRVDRGLHVFSGRGTPPVATHEVAGGICSLAGLNDPLLINIGVAATNWWLHHELAWVCRGSALVAYDRLSQWDAAATVAPQLERIRTQLIRASDVVCGLSTGSIADLQDALYVGHGVDEVWSTPGIDDRPEPPELARIPRPRAVYVGALSMRFDHAAIRRLADTGVEVVLIGMAPTPPVVELARSHPHVHMLGERPPEEVATHLLHADVGLIPHTDEPFTASMEPHKAYNYAAAGLRTVVLNASCAEALRDHITVTADPDAFVAAVHRALDDGRLDDPRREAARALTWDRVAHRILDRLLTALGAETPAGEHDLAAALVGLGVGAAADATR